MTRHNHQQETRTEYRLVDESNPRIAHVAGFNADVDPARVADNIEIGMARCADDVKSRFANATVTDERVARWVRELVANAARRPMMPKITSGDSLLITGPTGVGKTHQAYGAMRALSVSGVSCCWKYVSMANLYGQLRDFDRGSVERTLEEYVSTMVLFLDDLGAEKWSEAKDEINYRLLNHRYEHRLPTLITTNLPLQTDPEEPDRETLPVRLGERVMSRLIGMADAVAIRGHDLRPEIRAGERRGEAA